MWNAVFIRGLRVSRPVCGNILNQNRRRNKPWQARMTSLFWRGCQSLRGVLADLANNFLENAYRPHRISAYLSALGVWGREYVHGILHLMGHIRMCMSWYSARLEAEKLTLKK